MCLWLVRILYHGAVMVLRPERGGLHKPQGPMYVGTPLEAMRIFVRSGAVNVPGAAGSNLGLLTCGEDGRVCAWRQARLTNASCTF